MRATLRVTLLGVLLAFALGRLAEAAPVRAIYPLSKVKAGQRAVGKSIFKGTYIQSFDIEIIGVLHRYEGTRSLILGKVLNGPVVTRKSGIIAGMSGSPVYINGKLIGAIALAWSMSKEPITGIRPIEEMLGAWKTEPQAAPAMPSMVQLPAPLRVAGKRIDRVRVGPAGRPETPGTMSLTPVGGFLQVSGFSARASRNLAQLFAPYGMRIVDSPGGGKVANLRPPLAPGASMGIQLVRGDFDISALGTVTMIEGGKLLAFGHELFQMGDVDIPLTGGYVYDIMPSLDISSKIMAPTQEIGRIYRDTDTAVAGDTKSRAQMLPVTIEVNDRGGVWRKFSVEVARLREMMPTLVGQSVLTAVDETRHRIARGSVKVTLDIEVAGRPTLHRRDYAYSDADAAMAAIPTVLSPLSVFMDSPFGKLPMKAVHLRVECDDVRRTATLERLTAARSRFRAGETVPLTVTVRPYGKTPVQIPVTLQLPADMPKGTLRVVLTNGNEATEARSAIGAPRPDPTNLDQLLDRYLQRNSSFELVAQASLTRGSASLLGSDLPDLPRPAFDVLQSTHPSDLRVMPSVLKVVVPTEWQLQGRQTATIQVDSDLAAPAAARTETTPIARPTPPAAAETSDEEEDSSDDEASDYDVAAFGLPAAELLAAAAPAAKDAPKPAQGAAKPEPAKPAEPPRPKEPEKEQKPLTSALPQWVQQSPSDFAKAKLQGVSLDFEGTLSLAPTRTELATLPAGVVWSVAARAGVVYAGTGTDGVIYRVSAPGQVAPFFSTGEMNVHALAFDAAGSLYAGTSPRGRLFRITPEGKGELLYDSDSAYLWCLLVTPDGTVYAGAGSPARVYRLPPQGAPSVFAELPATNVLSLARSATGDLYAGTSGLGMVYRVTPDGTVSVVTQTPGTSVSALALDAQGTLYAASTPTGDIVRLPATGLAGLFVHTEQPDIFGLAALPNGDLLATLGPNGSLTRVTGANAWRTLYRTDTGLMTALALDGDTLYAASSAPSVLAQYALTGPATGQLESALLDADREARWGRVTVTADTPTGTQVSVETRSGDGPLPDSHWSAWTATTEGAIQSPAARYLQYRLTLSSTGEARPVVKEIRITRQPRNRPPQVGLRAPTGGTSIAKKFTVKWESRDLDQNTLSYDLDLSSDLGATWKEVKHDLTDAKYEWDTSKATDGKCVLRVTASDRRSQPWSPETDTDWAVVTVDNTAPTVTITKDSVVVAEDKHVTLSGTAADKLTAIVSVEYRVDEGEWTSLPFSPLDAPTVQFTISTGVLAPGERKLEVRAFDSAGNLANEKATATVPAPAKPVEAAPTKPAEVAPAKPAPTTPVKEGAS